MALRATATLALSTRSHTGNLWHRNSCHPRNLRRKLDLRCDLLLVFTVLICNLIVDPLNQVRKAVLERISKGVPTEAPAATTMRGLAAALAHAAEFPASNLQRAESTD